MHFQHHTEETDFDIRYWIPKKNIVETVLQSQQSFSTFYHYTDIVNWKMPKIP